MYSLLLTTALPLLLSTAVQAVPLDSNHDLAERQIKVLAGAPVSNISVKADNLVQCAQSTISWSGAVAPYSLSISTGGLYLPSKQLETHGGLNDANYQWTVTQPEGTGMYFQITDGNGQVGYVQNIFVGGSSDSSCLEGGSSSSSSAVQQAPSSSQAQSAPESSSQAAAVAPAPAASTSADQVVTVTSTSRAVASSSSAAAVVPVAAGTTSPSAVVNGDGVVTETVSAVAAEQSDAAASSGTDSAAVVAVTTLTATGGPLGTTARQAQASSGTQTSTSVVSGSVQTSVPGNSAGKLGGVSTVGVIVGGLLVGMTAMLC